jgi:hypothetical protein
MHVKLVRIRYPRWWATALWILLAATLIVPIVLLILRVIKVY